MVLHDEDILFAIIDAVENDIENISISSYPSIYLFLKGQDKITNYIIYEDSNINSKMIIDFIKSNMYILLTLVIKIDLIILLNQNFNPYV